MVVGHNISLNKNLIERTGGFSNNFVGWGLEDTCFGARAIASGAFVIPVLKTGVLHINHPPRSGSESKQNKEYEENLKIYKNLIERDV